MEEIEKIISAISEVTGLDGWSIKFGKTDECKEARDILCYIALKDMYGLTWTLMEELNFRKSQVFFSADRCKERMEEDLSYVYKMNEIRKKLGLSSIMRGMIEQAEEQQRNKDMELAQKRSKENSKNIFGIKYSQSEEEQLKIAIQNAKAFMTDYCKIGSTADGRLTRCPY